MRRPEAPRRPTEPVPPELVGQALPVEGAPGAWRPPPEWPPASRAAKASGCISPPPVPARWRSQPGCSSNDRLTLVGPIAHPRELVGVSALPGLKPACGGGCFETGMRRAGRGACGLA